MKGIYPGKLMHRFGIEMNKALLTKSGIVTEHYTAVFIILRQLRNESTQIYRLLTKLGLRISTDRNRNEFN